MNPILHLALQAVILGGLNVALYYLGRLHEREKWNELIRSGRLPRPNEPRWV